MRRIPIAGAGDLLGRARQTRLVRLGLGCSVAAVLAAAVWQTVGRGADPGPIVRPGRNTVLALDVSTSIRPKLYRQIDVTLTRATRAGGRLGLVVFSDTAYELLAPGTPAVELEKLDRFFRSLSAKPANVPTLALGRRRYLQAPWSRTLSSGTRISTGLALARQVLERDAHGRGAVVLLSDLGDEIGDLAEFAAEAQLLAQQGTQLRIVALSPKPSDLKLTRQLLAGSRGTIVEAADPDVHTRLGSDHSGPRIAILALGCALLLLLALNEMLCARLVLRPGKGMR